MGEEEKKPVDGNKPEEGKKTAAVEEAPKTEKPAEEKKSDEVAAPPPPPKEIVLKVFMHCEGCATKVRRCLKGFEGVEEVLTDCKTSKVVVKGEKADPAKVFERVQRKSHRHVELVSPLPPPPLPEEAQKPAEKEVAKPEEKKPEPPVIAVVLGVYMHCDACAEEIKRRIQKMKGVESAEPDLKSSQVTVKGVFDPKDLADYVFKRTGKHATIIKVEPVKKDEEKPKEEKKAEEGEKKAEEPPKEGGAAPAPAGEAAAKPEEAAAADLKMEMKRIEMYNYNLQNYQLYHQRFVQEMNNYPPQMFSDENPNACSVM